SVFEAVQTVLRQEQFPVIIGGEHSVSIGAVRAVHNHNSHFSVLQLDAHSDLRDTYLGSGLNHACVMARIREICPIVQVGIRSMDITEMDGLDRERVFFAHEIHDREDWMDRALDLLEDRVYVTIDLDVFDPGIMPSTGTPEPGGLGWYPVMRLLKRVADRKTVIGFDVVELCPGANKAPDFMAARLIYQFLSYIWR
ncbi:MAG: agmatinase family protein, partial [bacterium]